MIKLTSISINSIMSIKLLIQILNYTIVDNYYQVIELNLSDFGLNVLVHLHAKYIGSLSLLKSMEIHWNCYRHILMQISMDHIWTWWCQVCSLVSWFFLSLWTWCDGWPQQLNVDKSRSEIGNKINKHQV